MLEQDVRGESRDEFINTLGYIPHKNWYHESSTRRGQRDALGQVRSTWLCGISLTASGSATK